MESVDAKIARAGEHLNSLTTEIFAALRAENRKAIVKANDNAAWLVYFVEDHIPPIRISTLVGDCIFNLRSALDNLVCGLVRTRKPHARCVGTRFPIYSDPDNWQENWRNDLKGVSREARAVVKALQPCFRPYGASEDDPLFILNTLSNIDKHRAVLLGGRWDSDFGFNIRLNDGRTERFVLPEPLYSGNPTTISLPFKPSDVLPHVHIQTFGTAQMYFLEEGPWRNKPILEVMASLFQHVKERVIPRFKPFFRQTL